MQSKYCAFVFIKSALCENIFIKNGLAESGDQAEYLRGLLRDRDKGEIFDLKLGGVGMGFSEAVSIKFTRC